MASLTLHNTKYLLTWPKSDQLTNEIIMGHLQEIGQLKKYIVVCEEEHEDGLNHHHAVIIFARNINYRINIFTIDECVCNVRIIGRSDKDIRNAIKYVKKDGKFIEWGTEPLKKKKEKKRNKILYALEHDNKDCINSGMYTINELTRLDFIRNMVKPSWPMYKKREVLWFHGETGSGKTKYAFEYLTEKGYNYIDDIWLGSANMNTFFIGYCGQRACILDDMRPGCIRFELLLRILDGYPVNVNIKGSHCPWLCESIIITAPVKPNEMYVNRETGQEWDNLDQLIRRIDSIIAFPRDESI